MPLRHRSRSRFLACALSCLAAARLAGAGHGAIASTPASRQVSATGTATTWRNVNITAGGFVDRLLFSPLRRGLAYARTDIGGAYRWNSGSALGPLERPGTDTQHQYGWPGQLVAGDPRIYGRVYLGTNGRGIIYGDIASAGQ